MPASVRICLLLAACLLLGPSTHAHAVAAPPSTSVRADTTAPAHPAYQRLQDALQRYQRLADAGGWPDVPAQGVTHQGDTTARVLPLRERLRDARILSEEAAAERDSVYDEALAGAVYRFQQRYGLATDSLLGPNTAAAMNVPVEQRIEQIKTNLDRWRDLPSDLGERYVIVNVPAFNLQAYDDGEQVLKMGVIVGKAYNDRATPLFSDKMEHLIFSPYWNVPPSIANDEILPKARGNRDYLTANDYQIVSHYGPGAKVYDPYSVSLDRVASGDLRVREEPGPNNALGLVKFMFPNQYAVYLHDTPADNLFDRNERDFSHGCIRVERPEDLAVYALADKQSWDRERIHQAMHDGEWQKVELNDAIPVYIVYWTAFADADGAVHFAEDIYGLD